MPGERTSEGIAARSAVRRSTILTPSEAATSRLSASSSHAITAAPPLVSACAAAGPDYGAAEHRERAGARHMIDLQVSSEDRVAGEIGDKGEAAGGEHRRYDGEAIEPVRQVDGVRGADHDQDVESNEEAAEGNEQI